MGQHLPVFSTCLLSMWLKPRGNLRTENSDKSSIIRKTVLSPSLLFIPKELSELNRIVPNFPLNYFDLARNIYAAKGYCLREINCGNFFHAELARAAKKLGYRGRQILRGAQQALNRGVRRILE